MLSEKSHRKTDIIWSHLNMDSKNTKQMNKQKTETDTHTENKLKVAREEEGRGMVKKGKGD